MYSLPPMTSSAWESVLVVPFTAPRPVWMMAIPSPERGPVGPRLARAPPAPLNVQPVRPLSKPPLLIWPKLPLPLPPPGVPPPAGGPVSGLPPDGGSPVSPLTGAWLGVCTPWVGDWLSSVGTMPVETKVATWVALPVSDWSRLVWNAWSGSFTACRLVSTRTAASRSASLTAATTLFFAPCPGGSGLVGPPWNWYVQSPEWQIAVVRFWDAS